MQSSFRRPASVLGALIIPIALITLGLINPLAAVAQGDPNSDSAADGVGVARISFIQGNVALQRGDADDSFAAVLNTPLLGGDYVTTGTESRAEIQLDGNTQLRLGWDVQLRFNHLDPANRNIQLAAGTLDLHLSHGTDGSSVIDTPSIEVKPQAGGTYRVSITGDGKTLVTVRSGSAQIDTPQGAQNLQPGTTLSAQGDAANPSLQFTSAIAYDSFDRFNADRDRADTPAIADAGFVNADVGGVEDLDTYGRWVSDGSYGHVWVPASVGSDWAPYRNGRWVWEAGYGWTWVASEPWGWAPYHYGSWYNSPTYGWCWYPPQPHVYVPWRPALVAFIGLGGGGSGFSLSFGGGNAFGQIGWVPLAPFEPYHPWWGNGYGQRNGTVVNNLTRVTNVTNITNINVYKNLQYNAASSVSSQRFLQGDFAHNEAVTAPQLRGAQAFHGALPVVPTASNLRFSAAPATPPVTVHPALMQRAFAGHAVAVQRTPFTTERVSLATATRAAVTPLHFKDAQSTPVVTPAVPNAFHPPTTPTPRYAPVAPAAAQTHQVSVPAANYHAPTASSASHPPLEPDTTRKLEDAHTPHPSHSGPSAPIEHTAAPTEHRAAPASHAKPEKHDASAHDGHEPPHNR
jgi:hypothetical protein